MNVALRDRLRRLIRCPLRQDEPLAPFTSFRIGGPAALLAEPRTTLELQDVVQVIRSEDAPCFYLGHGSNILIADAGFDGVVIRAQGELCESEFRNADLVAGPGARLLDVTALAARHGLSGMEPLCGIPGSVGGGLYMNAGAYGGEISDVLVSVDVLTPTNTILNMQTADIGFAYRSAPGLADKLILHSRYRLAAGNRRSIYAEMRRVWKLRRAKQPLAFPSAGSIFKRPPGDYAGRLIEAVGGKGARVGGALVPHKHAGIFVNIGGASAADVAALVRDIRRRVYENFQIMLEPEIKPVGFDRDPFALTD